METKKIATIITLVFFAGVVLGVPIGTIISQEQYDNIDFSTRNLDITIDSKEKTEGAIQVNISYTTLEKIETGDWNVVRHYDTLSFDLENYYNCRLNGSTKTECISNAKTILIYQAKVLKTNIKTALEENKTKDYLNEITANDITISNEELNEE